MVNKEVIVFFLVAIIAATIGFFSIKYLGRDNPVEQQMEKVIKDQTGLELDLSPEAKAPA